MLLQTNSYVVPKEKRTEHARLMARFRQCFRRLGSAFEVYEQTGPGFSGDGGGRFVQMMRFRDRRHQQEVHIREQEDKVAQQLIADFCQLVNLPYQQQQGLFAAGFYASVLQERPESLSPAPSKPNPPAMPEATPQEPQESAAPPPPPPPPTALPDDEAGEHDPVAGGPLDEHPSAEPAPQAPYELPDDSIAAHPHEEPEDDVLEGVLEEDEIDHQKPGHLDPHADSSASR